MGCGKTTIGKKLANKISLPFFDLDQLIENEVCMPISDYFEKYGEGKFRLIEQKILQKTFTIKGAVVATGGGTACFFDNMLEMSKNGLSCYIKADVNLLVTRLKESKDKRPLIKNLEDDQLASYLTNLLTERRRYYEQAQFTVEAKNLSAEKLLSAMEINI